LVNSLTHHDTPLNKGWHDYNESLIERGRDLIDVSFLKAYNKEIKKMNNGKVGAPFQYSDSYVQFQNRKESASFLTNGVLGLALGILFY
jgi:hypothetical protein